NGKDFSVPLSRQARAIVAELRAVTGDKRRYLFSLDDDTPMPGEYLNRALREMDYDTKTGHCAHGFRSTAPTSLNDQGQFREGAIERQLAHVKKDKVAGAYNRAEYWSEREPMMQHWADRLDYLRDGAEVVPLRRAGVRDDRQERQRQTHAGIEPAQSG